MLPHFTYKRAASREEAAAHLGEAGAMPLGGGTDLLVFLAEELAHPTSLVDLREIGGFRDITVMEDGGLRIGGGARIDDLARDPRVTSKYPVLAKACESVGTPALRQMGTIAGNLCQRPRCWYFRRGIPCFKSGGTSCPAVGGENQYLAVLDGGPCYAVHPSDPAVALVALDAAVEISRKSDGREPTRTRLVRIDQLYVLPSKRLDRETDLADGEFVSAVLLPADAAASDPSMQHYYKQMQRGAWDFALASLAAVRRADGGARLVLGGVAPRPWRVPHSIEEDVASGGLDDDAVETLAQRALYDARPMSKNAYKVELAAALLRRGIRDLTA